MATSQELPPQLHPHMTQFSIRDKEDPQPASLHPPYPLHTPPKRSNPQQHMHINKTLQHYHQ